MATRSENKGACGCCGGGCECCSMYDWSPPTPPGYFAEWDVTYGGNTYRFRKVAGRCTWETDDGLQRIFAGTISFGTITPSNFHFLYTYADADDADEDAASLVGQVNHPEFGEDDWWCREESNENAMTEYVAMENVVPVTGTWVECLE